MTCTDTKRSVALVQQRAGILSQMAAIVAGAERQARELRGDELLQYDRLAGQSATVLAELKKVDPLAAKVAASNSATPRAAGTAVPATRPPADGRLNSTVSRTAPPPLAPLRRLTQDLQSGIRFDRDRVHARDGQASSGKIQGYGTLFNVLFHPRDRSGTRALVLPGAIDLTGSDMLLCRGHDASRRYASISAGTLRAWQDERGLAIEAMPERSGSGQDLLRAVANSSEAGMSLTFLAGRTSAFEVVRGERVEVIKRSRVSEVSTVRRPLCPGASCWLVK